MATWQELYVMLLEEQMTPHEIIARLNVRPSRLRELLASRRLASRLRLAESLAEERRGHAVAHEAGSAANKLGELIGSDRPETARKACLDVLEAAEEVRRRRVQQEWFPRWMSDAPGAPRR